MEVFLVMLVAAFRPIASVELAGGNLFDLAGIGLFVFAAFAFLMNGALRQALNISSVDLIVIAFAAWCAAIFFIYLEEASARDVAKLLIPLLSYIVVKNVIRTRAHYKALLLWMIVGFTVAALASAVVIWKGQGIDYVSYWTGVPRWEGAYKGAHNFGHSMALFVMLVALYLHLTHFSSSGEAIKSSYWRLIPIAAGTLGLWGLYMSQTRSAILGLVIFFGIYFYLTSKKYLLIVFACIAIIGTVTMPYWLPALLPDLILLEQGKIEASELGSGRPQYWQHNLALFTQLPLDQKIAGVGIGNKAPTMYVSEDEALDSHNDWLDLLIQTGLVGVTLFFVLQLLIFKAVLRLPREDRIPILALFLAVNVMMFVSNSYVWRIGVAHVYYMVIAFVEIRFSTMAVTAQPSSEGTFYTSGLHLKRRSADGTAASGYRRL